MKLEKTKNIAVIAVLFLISLLIVMQSPLNIVWAGNAGVDSSVFKYVGFVMSKGGMPYKDVFDHKGPLIYIYNFAGQSISYYRGVWIVELISMLTFCCIAYKTARMFCSRISSVLILMVACAPFSIYFDGGNLTEEYALPFIAVAIYIYLDFFLNSKISRIRLIFCGAGFGSVCLLRPNMAGVWVIFSIAVLVKDIHKRERKLPYFLCFFLLGTAAAVMPIMIWLIINSAFPAFVRDYIIYNFKYIGDGTRANIITKYDSMTYFLENTLILLSILILVYQCRLKKNIFINVSYLTYEICNIIFMSLSGYHHAHYGMVLIPMLLYPYAIIFSEKFSAGFRGAGRFVLASFITLTIFEPWKTIVQSTIDNLHKASTNDEIPFYNERHTIIGLVEANTSENDKIIVIGNNDIWYVLTQREAASVYSYQLPVATTNNEILTEYQNDLIENQPYIVINCCEGSVDEPFLFPNKSQYELLYEGGNNVNVYRMK